MPHVISNSESRSRPPHCILVCVRVCVCACMFKCGASKRHARNETLATGRLRLPDLLLDSHWEVSRFSYSRQFPMFLLSVSYNLLSGDGVERIHSGWMQYNEQPGFGKEECMDDSTKDTPLFISSLFSLLITY